MTLPYERSRAVIETYYFLCELLGRPRVPKGIREEASNLLRHYPNPSQVLRAGWQELADHEFVMEPVFGVGATFNAEPPFPLEQVRRRSSTETASVVTPGVSANLSDDTSA